MPIAMTLGATTATTQVLNFAGYTGASIEIQYAPREDFDFCVAPSFTIAAAATHTLQVLNQASTYYVRSREIIAAVPGPWVATQAFRTSLTTAQTTTPAAVMITPAMIVVPNPVLAWAADNVVAGYPVANLGLDAPVAWRSSHATVHAFNVTMAPETIDTIALLMSNAPEAATVTIKASNVAANVAGAPSYSVVGSAFRASANLPGRYGYHGLFRLASPQAYTFWRVEITCAAPGALFHLEHAIFGLNRSSKNYSLDKSEAPLDFGSLERGRSGVPIRSRGARGRRIDFDLSRMSEAQNETIYQDLGRKVGLTDPVLVVPNSKTGAFLHDRIAYGALTSMRTVNDASPIFTRSFSVESILP